MNVPRRSMRTPVKGSRFSIGDFVGREIDITAAK
jgi:hypothetical protein